MRDYHGLLAEIARPRLVGTPEHARVREVLKAELAERGFVVMEHRFTAWSLLHRLGRAPLEGVNLIAVRPRTRVAVWLAAHYDSKGQPISMATRLLAVGLLMLGALELGQLAVRKVLGSWHASVVDAALGAAGVLGAVMLSGNRVTNESPGALDNASGIVTMLAVVDALPPASGVGVILPDAEEYGLLGARALARERSALLQDTAVLNFDGIDDRGETIALVHRAGPLVGRIARALGGRRARWLPVVVDGLALAKGARECVTIMRGDWRTARLVHTPRDGAERLTLQGSREVARAVAAALR